MTNEELIHAMQLARETVKDNIPLYMLMGYAIEALEAK